MRIAILSDGVHPYVIGGMQRHTFYLCKYLSQHGIKITLVHFNKSDLDISKMEIFSKEENANIESIVIPFPVGDKLPGHYVRASYKYSTLIYQHLQDRWKEFDFIYTKGFSGWKLIQEKLKNPKDFPPIGVKFHGYEMFQKQADFISKLKSIVLKNPVKWISRHADYVFSYGGKITSIIQELGVPLNRILEIPAGIEKEWVSEKVLEASKPVIFTYLGRYERRKGIEELNVVLTNICQQNTEFEFRFIGPFDEQHKLNFKNCKYFGVITDNQKLKSILDDSDFLVCPSWSEGMPNVILEAMARGNAIIASDVGAVSLLVESSNGILISPGNHKELQNAIYTAIHASVDKIHQMKENSRIKIKNEFTSNFIAKYLIEKLKNTIKNNEQNKRS